MAEDVPMKIVWKFEPPTPIAGTDRFLNTVETEVSIKTALKYAFTTIWAVLMATFVYPDHKLTHVMVEPYLSHKGSQHDSNSVL